jgi:hypothetical protein
VFFFCVGGIALAFCVLRVALGFYGRVLSSFYERLVVDFVARVVFEQVWEREVLLTVRVREASGWRVAGHVRDLPSLVLRDQALPVDLRGTEGPTARLLIDGPPGLWFFDRVVLAVEDGSATTERRVGLSAAVTDDGRDIVSVLSSADYRCYLLRPG